MLVLGKKAKRSTYLDGCRYLVSLSGVGSFAKVLNTDILGFEKRQKGSEERRRLPMRILQRSAQSERGHLARRTGCYRLTAIPVGRRRPKIPRFTYRKHKSVHYRVFASGLLYCLGSNFCRHVSEYWLGRGKKFISQAKKGKSL